MGLRAWLANKIVTPLASDCGTPPRADGRKGQCYPALEVKRFGVPVSQCVAYDIDRQFLVRYRLDPKGAPVIVNNDLDCITEYGGISVHWRPDVPR